MARFETILDFTSYDVDVAIRSEGCRHTRHMARGEVGAVVGLGLRNCYGGKAPAVQQVRAQGGADAAHPEAGALGTAR